MTPTSVTVSNRCSWTVLDGPVVTTYFTGKRTTLVQVSRTKGTLHFWECWRRWPPSQVSTSGRCLVPSNKTWISRHHLGESKLGNSKHLNQVLLNKWEEWPLVLNALLSRKNQMRRLLTFKPRWNLQLTFLRSPPCPSSRRPRYL